MKFAMYSNFIETLLKEGTDKTAEKMHALGLSCGEVLDNAGAGRTPLLTDTETAKKAGADLAARGGALGAGYYSSAKEAFANLTKCLEVEPEKSWKGAVQDAYGRWKEELDRLV